MNSARFDQSELLKLCGKVRDETISAAEFAQLEEMLLTQPQAFQFYRRFMSLCSKLEQTAEMETNGSGIDLWDDATEAPSGVDSEIMLPRRPKKKRRSLQQKAKPSRFRLYSGITAAISASAVLLFVFANRNASTEMSGLAAVKNAYQAVWANQAEVIVGQRIDAGEYRLVSGAVQLKFDNGAEVLVQAPSIFRLDDSLRAGLLSGSLSLNIPSDATGFRVETPFGTVIDHGTRIGVLVDGSDGMQVHVFEGQAEALRKDSQDSTMLEAGQAVDVKETTSERIPAQRAYFAEDFDQLADLPLVTGDVELLISPPQSIRRVASELVDVGRATIFAERTNVVLDKDVPISFSTSGQPSRLQASDNVISEGSVVDSFMVHVATPRKIRRTAEWIVVQGRIAFKRPIVGVISFEPRESQAVFGNPSTEYPKDKKTGLEDSIDGDAARADWLSLSDDRMSLEFRLQIHGREAAEQEDFVDQFRVLVEAK